MKDTKECKQNGPSIEDVVHTPDGIEITAKQLEPVSHFCTMGRFTRLTVRDPGLPEVLISHIDTGLHITIQHRIALHPGLLKYAVLEICNAVMAATRLYSKKEPNLHPKIKSASWSRFNNLSWTFEMPFETSGVQLIEAIRASNEFVWTHAVGILEFKKKSGELE